PDPGSSLAAASVAARGGDLAPGICRVLHRLPGNPDVPVAHGRGRTTDLDPGTWAHLRVGCGGNPGRRTDRRRAGSEPDDVCRAGAGHAARSVARTTRRSAHP